MDDTRDFVTQLINVQTRLFGFILSLLGDRDAADDVLQETNVVIWDKRSQFEPGTDFGAWACTIAHFQIRAYRQRRARDRHRFNDALTESLAQVATQRTADLDARRTALRECLGALPTKQRELLDRRYAGQESVGQIAEGVGRPTNSVYQTLYRLRGALMQCIEQKLTAGGAADPA